MPSWVEVLAYALAGALLIGAALVGVAFALPEASRMPLFVVGGVARRSGVAGLSGVVAGVRVDGPVTVARGTAGARQPGARQPGAQEGASRYSWRARPGGLACRSFWDATR